MKQCKYRMHTAIIIEPRVLDHTVTILNHFVNILGDWEFIFYCGKNTKLYWEKTELDKKYELRELEVNNFNHSNLYNDFLKQKKLWESLRGEFVLTFQLDTWIFQHHVYNIDFFIKLNKSYIGGNMSYHWNELIRESIHFPYNNFNGGLSLRKRTDMIKIIETFPPENTKESHFSHSIKTDAEDVYFTLGCIFLGLPIGNDEVSSHFAVNTIMKDDFFGIHQPCIDIVSHINNKLPYLAKLNPYLKLPYQPESTKIKIAIFNGFDFHDELYGYLIHYCKTMQYELTIYCRPDTMKWLSFYYSMFSFMRKDISTFHNNYDCIFLITDDDPYYHGDIKKTICMDHFYKIRSPQYIHRITTRPFDDRPHALPIYPILNEKRIQENTIFIIGHSDQYDISILNKIRSAKPITIHVISRNVNLDLFKGCKYPVIGHSSISTFDMMDRIEKASYIITDVALPKDNTHESMSGAIPLAFSTLTPLILSKETNAYYQFKNCIEYEEEIVLRDIDIHQLRLERDAIIQRNHEVLSNIASFSNKRVLI